MMNVHELVKLPHGEAVKKIKKAGLWDERKLDSGGDEQEWIVTVSVTYEAHENREIPVFASSYDEACELAEDEVYGDYDVIEAEAIKAEALK